MMSEFKKIEARLHKEFEKKKNTLFAKALGVNTLSFHQVDDVFGNCTWHINIDQYHIAIRLDKYNNCWAEFEKKDPKIPADYLVKFRKFLNEYLESPNTYRHRSGTGFLISYYNNFKTRLTLQEIGDLCRIDLHDPEDGEGFGFRRWLLGSNFYIKYFPTLRSGSGNTDNNLERDISFNNITEKVNWNTFVTLIV